MGLGRLAYHFVRAPIGRVLRSFGEGGPLQQRRTAAGRAEMESAAASLPTVSATSGKPIEVHVLTGRKFWYQTAFCLWTLARHSNRPLAACIYDDGTLTADLQQSLGRVFPGTRFFGQSAILERLDAILPAARYPALRERWLHYPNIRKLTDIHAGAAGWRLVLDSDLLFFRRPDFLLQWLDSPGLPLHAVDTVTSYGYSRGLLESLAGRTLPERLNVGLCGLRSEALDWDRIEYWCATLIAGEGTHYFLEQALVALLLAGHECAIAPESDYVTLPCPPEATDCRAVMHHYVADSKRWYFQFNWRAARGQ